MKPNFTGDRPFLLAVRDGDGGGGGGSGGSGYSDYGAAGAGTSPSSNSGFSDYGNADAGTGKSASAGLGAAAPSSTGDGFSSYGMDGAGTCHGMSAGRSGGGTGLSAAYSQAASTMGRANVSSIGGTFGRTGTSPAVAYAQFANGMTPIGMRGLSSAPVGYISSRAAEDQSMASLYDYGKEVVGVVAAGPGWTQVALRDGTVETRSGDRSARNNNPGNIEYTGRYGEVGTDGRFGVYASREEGKKAMEGLVFGPYYAGRTISSAISKYAPAHENDTNAYSNSVAAAVGVPADTPLADLDASQRSAMVDAMISVEGSRTYSVETNTVGTNLGTAPSGRHPSIPGGVSVSEPQSSLPSGANAPTPTPAPRGGIGAPAISARSAEDQSMVDLAAMEATKSSFSQPTGLSVAEALSQQEQAQRSQAFNDELAQHNDDFWSRQDPISPELSGAPEAHEGKSSRFAETYLGAPPTGKDALTPTPAPRSAAAEGRPAETTPDSTPKGEKSIGSKIGSAVVDVVTGLNPVTGIANLGLKAATGRSVGDRAMDFVGSLEGFKGDAGDFAGDDPGYLELVQQSDGTYRYERQESKPASASDFTSTYLRRSEPKRPTPAEKWPRRKAA